MDIEQWNVFNTMLLASALVVCGFSSDGIVTDGYEVIVRQLSMIFCKMQFGGDERLGGVGTWDSARIVSGTMGVSRFPSDQSCEIRARRAHRSDSVNQKTCHDGLANTRRLNVTNLTDERIGDLAPMQNHQFSS